MAKILNKTVKKTSPKVKKAPIKKEAKVSKPKLVLPTYKDVVAAARRIKGFAHKTPVMTSSTLDK